jgi:alpha-tubulin suppressor-like RCC1 family protein
MTEQRKVMTRREALALLPLVPWAVRLSRRAAPARVRRVFPGGDHTLILDSDGTLKVWSSALKPNGSGEMGLGHFDPVERYTLFAIPGLSKVVSAAAGWGSSFAVLADGRIMAWGTRSRGILGITPRAEVEVSAQARPNAHTPTPIAAQFDAIDLSVGSDHVLALARDGTVWSWGYGPKGQLGIGPPPIINFKTHTPAAMTFVPFPVQIPGLTDVIAVAAGDDHSMALKRDGTIVSWGGNKFGQLGDGTTVDRTTPAPVPGIGKVIAIAADSFSVAVLADGRALSWGYASSGSLGRPPFSGIGPPNPVPTVVPGVTGARTISASVATVVALTQAGTVISWGFNPYGEAGQGIAFSQSVGLPAGPVKGLTGVESAVTRSAHGVAVLNDGRIMVWGRTPPHKTAAGERDFSHAPIPLVLNGLD